MTLKSVQEDTISYSYFFGGFVCKDDSLLIDVSTLLLYTFYDFGKLYLKKKQKNNKQTNKPE